MGLILLAIAIGLLTAGWNWMQEQHSSRTMEPRYVRETIPPVVASAIVSQRLLADVKALSYERFTDPERQQARDYIVQQLKLAGWQPQLQTFEGGINIYAEKPGTRPDAGTILLGSHYDTVERSPGADDNATAVATVLETARILAKQPTTRTLQVVFFDREEQGLLGSEAFVKQLPTSNRIQGAIVMDMIGYACHKPGCQSFPPLPTQPPTDKGNFLAVIGDQGHLPLVQSFSQIQNPQLPQILTLSIPTFGRFTPDLVRSDHAPFWRHDIGAVLVTDTANFRNPNYHKPTDTVQTIDQPFFFGAAQAVVNATTALLHSEQSLVTANGTLPVDRWPQ